MVEHTPLPWKIESDGVIASRDGQEVCDYSGPRCSLFGSERERANALTNANAEFIVRACNAHYQLVEALKKAKEVIYVWHGIGMSDDEAWKLYQQSPEMKQINDAFKLTEKT